jgi:chemotaxis protein CheY-P-specific phosphatase CheC
MALKDTAKLISHGLTSLSNVIETDTDISTIDLNLLENLNTNQSLNYIKLEQNLNVLEKDAERLEQLRKYKKRRRVKTRNGIRTGLKTG